MLLSSVAWTGGGDGTSWTDPGNWSDDAVPTSSDDVQITLSPSPTIEIDSGDQSVGSLTMTGGTLTVENAGVSFTVTGATAVSNTSLYAQDGATLALPQLTTFTSPETDLTDWRPPASTASLTCRR